MSAEPRRAATQDHEAGRLMRATMRADWEHPVWGIPLGLLLIVGDALLIPGDQGLTFGGKFVFCLSVAMLFAATLWAWRAPVKGGILMAGAFALAVVVAAASGDWFGGATQAPPWRGAIVPSVDLALVLVAVATWYAGRERGELLLVAAVTASGMVAYGQQAAPEWATLAGVGATLLFLAPAVRPFSRIVGLAMHMLALLGLIQQEPQWFAWTPYPFLTMVPVYLVALWWRDPGRPRRVAWWTAMVVGGGTLLLGASTLVGGLRTGLPLGDSFFMVGLGVGVASLFLGLRWLERRR